ncbi:unnamed protein product [Bemisia tabaci]|uniref:Thioredoxin domain-containing protein n=1 Tax=Bemisia tabaci TaxID=7038 RepID=A0A9P0F2W6_BEMTA|nr:PREDICTED: thioredoxin-related transmembrane protein 1-like [Bemisia tabaci]CAH0389666.1 unnamed protein product [Bemisia tabaci]
MALFNWQYFFFFILVSLSEHTGLAKTQILQLNEDNWESMLTGEWMVEFFAPWCPACQALQTQWEEFASWSRDLDIKVGQVDVTKSPGLSGRFMVTALPSIFHVLNGEFRQYKGSRDKEAFMTFIEQKKWEQVDAIPFWKSPASLQMSAVAKFFRLSQILRMVHTQLTEEYGVPIWCSYLMFAFGTIFIGALLGLILVFILDFIFPPKPAVLPKGRASQGGKGGSTEESDDELAQEELVDEQANPDTSPSVKKRKARKAD